MISLQNMKKGIYVCEACGGKGMIERYDPNILRQARLDGGISLRQMAREIGLSAAFLSDVELGRRNPNKAILDYLDELYSHGA